MKILNLFAGIGGNRTLWGESHEITAVEYDPKAAEIYQQRFPNDIVIVGDAYEYFINHYKEFDLIWGSPPCQTHSRLCVTNEAQDRGKLPDLRLYSLILFCKQFIKNMWIIENVKPYYKPLIHPSSEVGRHYIWSNFNIPKKKGRSLFSNDGTSLPNDELRAFHKITIDIPIKAQYLKNAVDYEMGKYILDCAVKPKQTTLF